MKHNHLIFVALMGGALANACGHEQASKPVAPTAETTAPQYTDESAKAAAADAPEYLIVKVPVGADGAEMNDQVETRELRGATSLDSAAAAETAFSSATTVAVANELDQDGSSNQWFGRSAWYWNTPWYPGKLLGRGLWWGRNPYRWSNGFAFAYNPYNHYYRGGCNYYVYNRTIGTPAPLPAQPLPGQHGPGQQGPVQPTPVQPTPVQPTPVQPTPVEPTNGYGDGAGYVRN